MGQAHIWAWPGPYVRPARARYGPGAWAGPMGLGPDPGPHIFGQEHVFRNMILKKTNIAYIIEG